MARPETGVKMTKEEQEAFDWAINQEYQSVAARYARTLAKYIQRNHDYGEVYAVSDKYVPVEIPAAEGRK